MRKLILILMLCAWASTAHAQTLASGSLTTSGQSISSPLSPGGADLRSVSVQVTGTWTGTITFQGSVDGTTYVSVLATNATDGTTSATTTSNGVFAFTNNGYRSVRASATAAMTGTAVVSIAQGYASGGAGGGSGDASSSNQINEILLLDSIEDLLIASAANDVAHDDSDTGFPVKIGGRADTTVPAAVSGDGDRVNAWFTPNGALVNRQTDGTNLMALDPCMTEAKTTTAFTQTSIANIITADANKKNYVCSIVLVAQAAEIINIVEDNDSGCGSVSAALAGSTTAGNGLSFAANGGFAMGNGQSSIFVGSANNRYLCISQSGSNRIAGSITWVQR